MLQPTSDEIQRRSLVLKAVCEKIKAAEPITLPSPKPDSAASSDYALLPIAYTPNDYNGTVGRYIYQFEGEDDLLHLFVIESAGQELLLSEAREVFEFLLPGFPTALTFVKSGTVSQHFFFGHDHVLDHLGF